MDKSGYLLYRNKRTFDLSAVLAFSSIREFMLKDRNTTHLTLKETTNILEKSVKIIMNSVVLDPMAPVFRMQSIPFFHDYSIGSCFESLNWFCPISIKGIHEELDLLLVEDSE